MWLTQAFTRFPFAIPENCRHLVSYMPREPKTKHPIRDLRKIIRKSQREFSLSIGISPSAMKRIENNDLALSRRVARKIQVETGIDPRSLLKAKGKLRTFSGEQYTTEFYKNWKKDFSWQDDEWTAVEAAKWLGSWIEILLRAATYGSKNRMRSVLNEIAETVDRCRVDFNLERPIDDILAKLRHRVKWDLIKPPQKWEREAFIATRKPRPSSRRRRKGTGSNIFRRPSVSQARGSARR
jgi:transcriptional regulator with XRE-family HTH domain